MPKMVGLDLAIEVRKIRDDIPIIISSGNKIVAQEIKSMKNVIFLKKPLLTLDLTVSIRNALDEIKGRDSGQAIT